MTKIIITRRSRFQAALNKFAVYLDGEEIGKIGNGETLEVTIPSESSSIYVATKVLGMHSLPDTF